MADAEREEEPVEGRARRRPDGPHEVARGGPGEALERLEILWRQRMQIGHVPDEARLDERARRLLAEPVAPPGEVLAKGPDPVAPGDAAGLRVGREAQSRPSASRALANAVPSTARTS